MISVRDCYQLRFNNSENKQRNDIWTVLCSSFFQKYIKYSDTVVDIGAGYCEFINNIKCAKKIAIDINPDIEKFANKEIEVVKTSGHEIPDKFDGKANVVFMSNFLEHMNSKEEVLSIIKRSHRLLKKGGKLIILQPNIDLVKEAYWSFLDHKVPLNESSLREAALMCDFTVVKLIKRFLPYTTKTTLLPKKPFLVKLYLKIPSFLRPFAGLSLVIAEKR